jgi:hypothetical protein
MCNGCKVQTGPLYNISIDSKDKCDLFSFKERCKKCTAKAILNCMINISDLSDCRVFDDDGNIVYFYNHYQSDKGLVQIDTIGIHKEILKLYQGDQKHD